MDDLVEYRDHEVFDYGHGVWRIIQYYSGKPSGQRSNRDDWVHSGKKLTNNLSRARSRILELALCNDWDWFVTLTISPELDRNDLNGWYRRFRTFIRNARQRRTDYEDFRFLLIPERHCNGSWHCHGLLRCIPDESLVSFADRLRLGDPVPVSLAKGGYFDWTDYSSRFGYCSLGRVNDPVRTAFYVTKYITKDLDRCVSDVGSKLYYCSLGLNRPENIGGFYGRSQFIDALLTSHEYCASGWIHPSNGFTWADICRLHFGGDDPYPRDAFMVDTDDFLKPVELFWDSTVYDYYDEMGEQLDFWNMASG